MLLMFSTQTKRNAFEYKANKTITIDYYANSKSWCCAQNNCKQIAHWGHAYEGVILLCPN